MRFFVDHNLTPRLITTVSSIHRDHEFRCARDEGLMAEDDIPLFAKLAARGFDAIITRDGNQLINPEERLALVESGLHWLGVSPPKAGGLLGLALDSAAITVGLTIVLPELHGGQRAFRFPAVPHQTEQRVKPVELQPKSREGTFRSRTDGSA